jgi:hypothetical protein
MAASSTITAGIATTTAISGRATLERTSEAAWRVSSVRLTSAPSHGNAKEPVTAAILVLALPEAVVGG